MSNTMLSESLGMASVTLDLVKQGFLLYLPINGHSTPDLIAVKEGLVLRIEVKAVNTFKDKTTSYPKQADKFDVLAQLDTSTGIIRYIPEISDALSVVRTETLTLKEREVLRAMRQ
jgi:hypothetical protein